MWLFARGRPLTPQELTIYRPYFAHIVLERARIVEGKVPFWLWPRMCAVVWRHRIFLRRDAYYAATPQGVALLGHELTHVSQFLHGMTVPDYLWSCRFGYRHSHYELAAYRQGTQIARDYVAFVSQATPKLASQGAPIAT